MGRKKKDFQVTTLSEQEVVTDESNEIHCALCGSSSNRITKDSVEYFTFKNREEDKITISFKFEGICDVCLKEKKTEILDKFSRRK